MSAEELKKTNRNKVVISVLKVMLLAAIVVGIPAYIYFFHGDWLRQFESFEDVVSYLQRYKWESVPIYIGLQIVQIVISVIPGQVFQFAAGYLYTFFPALFFSICGAFLGTALSFYLAKVLGHDFVHLFFGKEKTHDYVRKLNSKKAYMIVFILYLIPGLPKDVVSYAAGVSEMKFKPFILLSLIGRLPGMMGSIMIGSMWRNGEYVGMVLLGVFAVVAFALCIVYRKKINDFLDKAYDKISE